MLPKEKAFGRCVAWARHFQESGYTVVTWDEVEPYVAHPHPDDAAAYREVRRKKLKQLCAPEKDLAARFTFTESTHTIKLTVTPEEWRQLRWEAADRGMSLETYCQAHFDRSHVSAIELSGLRACEQQCRQVVTLLERERRLSLLLEEGGLAAEWLQDAVDNLQREMRELTAAIRDYMKEVKR